MTESIVPAPSSVAASGGLKTGSSSGSASDRQEPAYRVLVVEDDASQALFAEGVLRGAGIEARGVRTAAEVLPEMERFHPDLVLMDLHMPGMTGTDLIGLIRMHADFAHTPVVFLTGDPDVERQFEALEQGADDFLNKPIRPRHLIAAVQSRIKRARALNRQRTGDTSRNPETGLYHRPFLLQSIATALSGGGHAGGAFFIEIQGVAALRDRYGYSGFEQLMHDAGRRLADSAGKYPCARLNDSAFLVFAEGRDEHQLDAFARVLRDGIGQAAFDCDGIPQRLRAVVGFAALRHFAEPGAVLSALERAARAARSEAIGIVAHVPDTSALTVADTLVESLRAGLRDGTFELAFQPVVAVAGGEDAQFQALLRMRDADGTLKQAGVLVPAAEGAGLMPEIDRWVLAQAIERLHHRHQAQRGLRLFVSQSSRSLVDENHAQWLLQQLASQAIADGSLVIDLRLDDALVHPDMLRQFCETLRPAGVQFCLSQFLHGFEADALLQQLPLRYMRLSPRYAGARADPVLSERLRGVIENAHRLGLLVIGPQVEEPQGAATLWMSGIDLIQGNLVQQADGNLDFDFSNAVL